ncbi:fungal-specific transcription factor domain-containing protein [Xylariaceae sp. FL0016]|nr:fungal-specific transcription factor domain-containing protein [Xylariaceae sp. FL0016]
MEIGVVTPLDFAQQNARKRPRRASRPCDACRRAKTRCIRKDGDPNAARCLHCDLRGSSCTFHKGPPTRVRHHSSSNRQESPVAHSHSTAVGTCDTHSPPPHDHNGYLPVSTPRGGQEPVVPVSATPSEHGTVLSRAPCHQEVSPPDTSSNTDSVISSDYPVLGLDLGRFPELYGLGSDMEPVLMHHRPYDPKTHEFRLETHAIRRVLAPDDAHQYPVTFHFVDDHKAANADLAHGEAVAIEKMVQPHGQRVVELFWRHVHPCFPVICKEGFMRSYNMSHVSIPAPVLGAVYLSALRFWSYDPELSIRDAPDSSEMRQLAHRAVQNSYHRPKLFSIQAMLLLLQCQPEDPLNPDHTFDWGLTCQALAIGQCLGLHLDCSHWSIPRVEKNVRKRLSWALYMQDCWTALAYGRPLHIHDDDWAVPDLTDEDFADCESAERHEQEDERRSIIVTGKHHFILMVRLTKILAKILVDYYSVKKCNEQNTTLLFQNARPILDSLDQWVQAVPSKLLGMHITYQRRLSFNGSLWFSYYGVAMTLLRRLVRSTALEPSCADRALLGSVRQHALQVAQGAIGFVMALRHDHLEAFWYFATPYLFSLLGSFVTLLLVTSLSSQERSFWQDTLNSYLWNLRTRSKSSEPMQYAVNRLEGAILRGLEHALAVNVVEVADDSVSPPQAQNTTEVAEFMEFGDWDLYIAGVGAFDMLNTSNRSLVAYDHPTMM